MPDTRVDAAPEPRLGVAADVLARTLGDSAILIHLGTSRIYELNATSARIWELLAGGTTRADLIATLVHEFSADRETIAAAVDEVLDQFRAEGLL